MELKIWSKTFLNVYRSLEKITYAIDRIVLTTGLSSGGLNFSGNAYYTANKIIELTERKICLINLKVLIEETLNSLDKDSIRLLMLKYVDRLKSHEIAETMKISKRTYFRKQTKAINSFALALSRQGKTAENIKTMLLKEAWIKDLYERLLSQEIINISPKNKKDKPEVDENKMFNLACKAYQKLETSAMYV